MSVLFQYPLVDRVGFEGHPASPAPAHAQRFSILWWIELVLRGAASALRRLAPAQFQYPLVDRVGFEGPGKPPTTLIIPLFQYPLVDRVGFEGACART